MNQQKDMCEPIVVNKTCFFCGQRRLVRFNEHYLWCPNCLSIYTTMGLIERNCEHIDEDSPIVIELPRKMKLYKDKHFVLGTYNHMWCSVCGKSCIFDGW